MKSNRFLQIQATYHNPKAKHNNNIIGQDSYKLIPMPWRDFGKCFELGVSKEAMPYNVYNYENVNMGACSIQSALDILKDDGKQRFLDNLEKWDCILGKGMDNQMFDLIKHSSIHCKLDCKVLMHGYAVFTRRMLEHTELYVYIVITIQSMAPSFMLKSCCYDNVYQVSGVIQQFITKCVVGGRVMTNSNKQYHVKKKIADFDACNLYPSAMYFIQGFLKGLPKVFSDTSYEFLKQDVYFVRIKTIKLNRHLDFPLSSKLNEESGVREFINEMDNGITYIDEVGLEELIEYHKAEFETIDGYYYNEGREIRLIMLLKIYTILERS